MSTQELTSTLPFLSQANVLGQGFDIYGTYDTKSLLRPLFDLQNAPTDTFTFLGRDYAIPSIVRGIENTSSVYNEGTFVSREAFQSKIATFAGVEARYGAFSGEMQASFSLETSRTSDYFYAFKNLHTALGQLQLNPDTSFLTGDFTAAIAALPDTVNDDNIAAFADFFGRFGVYYTSQVSLGATFEFYNAVSIATSDTVMQIGAMLKAHYNGLFSSGSISTGITTSKEWKSYIENSSVSIATTGGDPTAGGKLQGIDTKAPSAATVAAYDAWLETVGANPAVGQFKLAGIWNLCGPKSTVVQAAWRLYGERMHPRLSIETASPAAVAPTITLGFEVKPPARPETLMGWQIAILDRTDVSTPDRVVFDRYYTIEPDRWAWEFEAMYNDMARDILASGYADTNHILLAVSFGMKPTCSPSRDFYGLLRSSGGGRQLADWAQGSDPGSNNPGTLCYALAGIFDQGADSGVEVLAEDWNKTVALNVAIYFYRMAYGGPFTLGLEPLPTAESAGTEAAG